MRKRWFLVQYVTFSIKTKQTDFYIRNIHRSIGILLKIIDKYFFFGNASKRVLNLLFYRKSCKFFGTEGVVISFGNFIWKNNLGILFGNNLTRGTEYPELSGISGK